MYTVKMTEEAERDILNHRHNSPKSVEKKIRQMIGRISEDPYTKEWHSEKMKAENCRSFRITKAHRLVFRIDRNAKTVRVLSAWGHYEDK